MPLINLTSEYGVVEKEKEMCARCGEKMIEMQPCHLICPNCGSHMDCSDKGTVW